MNETKEIKEAEIQAQIKIEIINNIPIIFASKELVSFALDLKARRNELRDSGDKGKEFTELNARYNRLEKAFYYRCDITGEICLISVLVKSGDQIISKKAFRKIQKINQKEQKMKEARKVIGMTELEAQIHRGYVTEEDVESVINDPITPEEREFLRDSYVIAIRYNSKDPAKDAYHNLIVRRIRKKRVNEEVDEMMKNLNFDEFKYKWKFKPLKYVQKWGLNDL